MSGQEETKAKGKPSQREAVNSVLNLLAIAIGLAGPLIQFSSARFTTVGVFVGIAVSIVAAAVVVLTAFGRQGDRRILIGILVLGALLIVMGFAGAFVSLSADDGGAFTHGRIGVIDGLYLSLTTFTTTGFGDITATTPAARAAVSLEMATTLAYVGFGLAAIVPRLRPASS